MKSDTPRTDAFEALAERPINWWDFARELEHDLNIANNWIEHHQNHVDDLIKENAALREKDEDWENAVAHARDHRCDEAHCTCVVPLLGKINQLERENAALREDKERLDSRTILLTENGERVHHVEVNLRAAIDAARKEARP